jgi:hypothetical protein
MLDIARFRLRCHSRFRLPFSDTPLGFFWERAFGPLGKMGLNFFGGTKELPDFIFFY